MRRSGRSPPRHDANEEGTGLLVEFITKYADLLPRTNRSGVETDTERIAMMTSALKKPGFDAMAPPLEAEMHLLLLEALTPELSLDDMLDKALGLAKAVFDVDVVEFYFPVRDDRKEATLWRPDAGADDDDDSDDGDGASTGFAGEVLEAAETGSVAFGADSLAAPIFERRPRNTDGGDGGGSPSHRGGQRGGSPRDRVIAVVALKKPKTDFTSLHEHALSFLANELESMLESKSRGRGVELEWRRARSTLDREMVDPLSELGSRERPKEALSRASRDARGSRDVGARVGRNTPNSSSSRGATATCRRHPSSRLPSSRSPASTCRRP